MKIQKILFSIIGIIAGVYIVTWLTILMRKEPINHPLATWNIWPIACTTSGCITSHTWQQYHNIAVTFARESGDQLPTTSESFTTAVRAHLIQSSLLLSPVTLPDVAHYRQEILNLSTDTSIFDMALYDNLILLPYLQQEALRSERSIESPEELYAILAKEHLTVILPFRYTWNKEAGSITTE